MRKYLIITVAAIGIFFYSCGNNNRKDVSKEVVSVKTVIAKKKPVSLPVRTSGILASKSEARLSFKTGGVIDKINVEEGERVNEDQLLASLDLSEISAQVEQARSAYEKALRDFERAENLYKDSVATLEQYQNARTALNVAESNLNIAEFNLRHSKIIAPSNGKILKRFAEENEIVGAGMPIFLFGSTEADWVVRAGITDKDIVKIARRDSAKINLDPYPGQSFSAYVSEIGEASDPYTGTYEVELTLDETNKPLVKGFIARVVIYPSDVNSFITIPVEALRGASGFKGTVFVVEDGKPKRKRVQLGTVIDGEIIVISGIEEGMTVITDGVNYLDDNTGIEIVK